MRQPGPPPPPWFPATPTILLSYFLLFSPFFPPSLAVIGKEGRKEKRKSFAIAIAAAIAMVSGYTDHPPLLFPSLLSFLSPLAGSHRERG
ncbi:hypothetical protein RHGRI_001186 [Rhododendron griersonianum]|uniref:Uncharacterized protein n=1 Tax=Rhododendron griersonianum TaxID=479676 RepID=A0AAV6LKF6_9ERIC|nr:hypothetical protein RHGRI_001186 [Rhododendron griersonianum]